jgi:N-acyl-D-aspartate/D-glutamate deacylase
MRARSPDTSGFVRNDRIFVFLTKGFIMTDHYDVLITGARIVDGSGNPYYRADIGIREGRIAALAPDLSSAQATRRIDADGLVASPGFIDAHSHDDGYILAEPTARLKVSQGVTTTVVGNCGHTLAPMPADKTDFLDKMSMMMGGQALPEVFYGIDTYSDYLEAVASAKPGINVVPLIGHGTIRIAVMGYENRAPAPEELERMKALTTDAMEAGAFGISSGLIYIPGIYAKTEEVAELARVAGRYNGIYTTHLRNEGSRQMAAIEEALTIGRAGGMPVHIAHHKIAGRTNWGMSGQTLARFHRAREEGQEVTCDQYPYRAGSTMLAAALPPAFAAGGPERYVEKLKDPAVRQSVIEMIASKDDSWQNLVGEAGFENVQISFSMAHPDYQGRSLADIASAENRSPYDVFFDLIIEEKTKVGMVVFMMDDADIERIMADPVTMIGSDGIPTLGESKTHPRMTSTFPRVLARYVREKRVLSLEGAVQKMTSLPAQTFRLKTKGLVKEGFDADLTLFDPKTVSDKGTYQDPLQPPEGIAYVLVNGVVAVAQGRFIGTDSGRVLRRGA